MVTRTDISGHWLDDLGQPRQHSGPLGIVVLVAFEQKVNVSASTIHMDSVGSF